MRRILMYALGSLRRNPTIAAVTVAGVAIGTLVVATVLVVDANTTPIGREPARPAAAATDFGPAEAAAGRRADGERLTVRFMHREGAEPVRPGLVPSQKGELAIPPPSGKPEARGGEADYQAMRVAVRLASLLAFLVGAVIVFYTMRYSVAARARELCLLLCLGEDRHRAAAAVALEALIVGLAGTLAGVGAALPFAKTLLHFGISTNGRWPLPGFAVPWGELAGMTAVGVLVALTGVIGPVLTILRLSVAEILQPRFVAPGRAEFGDGRRGFAWLIPPLLGASYLATRPFLESWLSVVSFFLIEASVIAVLAAATLYWIAPVLRAAIAAFEALLARALPVETFLAARRLRRTPRRIVVSIFGVTLVFSMLTALHDVTRALKNEIRAWATSALEPYSYLASGVRMADLDAVVDRARQRGILVIRLSKPVGGVLPFRIVHADDLNRYLGAVGRPLMAPGDVIVSRTLAARFGVSPGDGLEVVRGGKTWRFRLVDVNDDPGLFGNDGQYIDIKSYALFADGSPPFAGDIERTLGAYAIARPMPGARPMLTGAQERSLAPAFEVIGRGRSSNRWRYREIDKDFLIFDFILMMTVTLAAVGVANTMLIQVRARAREFAVLESVGIARAQVVRLVMVEGAIIGLVSAALAIGLGSAFGAVSVSFLDHFTLFDYVWRFSPKAAAAIMALGIATCVTAAAYPALTASRRSSAESLHYE